MAFLNKRDPKESYAQKAPVYSRKSRWQISDGIDYRDYEGVLPGDYSWSNRGFADDYADNPQQALGYLKSPRWRGADYIQDEQSHWYTNAFPPIPWAFWPRYSQNSRVDSYPAEELYGGPGMFQKQYGDWRAPDARWKDIAEVSGHKNAARSAYARRIWQDENRPVDMGSVDRNPRLHRTPNEYSFTREFDRFMGARNHDGRHMSMADHRRTGGNNLFGMKTTNTTRNTYRMAPSPFDYQIVNYPHTGQGQSPQQDSKTSPHSNYSQVSANSRWGLGL